MAIVFVPEIQQQNSCGRFPASGESLQNMGPELLEKEKNCSKWLPRRDKSRNAQGRGLNECPTAQSWRIPERWACNSAKLDRSTPWWCNIKMMMARQHKQWPWQDEQMGVRQRKASNGLCTISKWKCPSTRHKMASARWAKGQDRRSGVMAANGMITMQ